jgi:tetratricopeptide (TPR) repeat protein
VTETVAGGDCLERLAPSARARQPEALARLREVIASRRGERGLHREWAQLCEEAGEFGLALGEYQLALRDDPQDVMALTRLAVLHEERGELDRALHYAEARLRLAPADGEALSVVVNLLVAAEAFEAAADLLARSRERAHPTLVESLERQVETARRVVIDDEDESPVSSEPTEADAVRFAHTFAGRENLYARQWWNPDGRGGYAPVHEPLTPRVALNHLLGNVTVGVYVVRLDNTVGFFAIDLDVTKRGLAAARASIAEARRIRDLLGSEARRFTDALASIGVPAFVEDSGYKGRHLWVLLAAPEDAAVVRQFGQLFLARWTPRTPEFQVEFFPKQDSAGPGIGNLIKLPLGIHRRTGRWSRLLRPDGTAEPDPHGFLRAHPRLSREALHAAIVEMKRVPALSLVRQAGGEEDGAGDQDAHAAGPPPPAPPPVWTAADFQTNPEIAHLMRHCPVLDTLRIKVERHQRLTHEEQVVLAHSLGHSSAGVLAVNFLLDRCVDAAPAARLQSPLAGNPISCPKIRKRIPHVTASVPCNCRFDFAPEHYPTPRLHLRTLETAAGAPERPAEPAWEPVERARVLGLLRRRRQDLDQQIDAVEQELVSWLEREGLGELSVDDGVFRLEHPEGGLPALVWQSRHGGSTERFPAKILPLRPAAGQGA